MRKLILLISLSFFWIVSISGQTPLSGNYTIDASGAGDFISFSEAIDSLHAHGINAPVSFQVVAGIYEDQFIIGQISGSSETNTISFIGQDPTTTILKADSIIDLPSTSGSMNDAFILSNASHLLFENIGFRYDLPKSATLLNIIEGSNSVILKKCLFFLDPTTELNLGVMIQNAYDITIDSCELFANGDYGIACLYDSSFTLSNSKIHNALLGVYIDDTKDIYIRNNELSGSGVVGNPVFGEGIFVWFNTLNIYIENNIIHEGFRTGMYISGASEGINRIVNNVFRGDQRGARISTPYNDADTLFFYHNTVIGNEIGLELGDLRTDAAVYAENNLFASMIGPSLQIQSNNQLSTNSIWNHNAYVNSDTTAFPLVQIRVNFNVTNYYDLESYRIKYLRVDEQSYYVPLAYLDTSSYHILSATRFHFGNPKPGIDQDVEGDLRGLFGDAVDVGADEFSGFIGDISSISGTLFIDENGDGVQNNGEKGLANSKVMDTLHQHITFTDQHGDYILYKTANDTLVIKPISLNGFDIHPADSMILPLGSNVLEVNFAYVVNDVFSDFSIDYTSEIRRCFRTINGYITYQNQGTVVEDNIELSYTPDPFDSLIFSDPMWDQEVNGTYYWDLEPVEINERRTIRLRLKMPSVDALGESQIATVKISNTEAVIAEAQYTESIICAYDPNDKAVFPEGVGKDHLVLKTDSLEYLIRFQNTGNDTAFDIRIVDQLSEALDWDSFELLSVSHDVRTELNQQTGQLVFYFDDIQLVDSVANEPDSHGFVKFRINPRANIADSTVITNTGYIYFYWSQIRV